MTSTRASDIAAHAKPKALSPIEHAAKLQPRARSALFVLLTVSAGCAADLEGDSFPNAILGGSSAGAGATGGVGASGGAAGSSAGNPPSGGSGGSMTGAVVVPPLSPCVQQIFTAPGSGCVTCHSAAFATTEAFGKLDLSGADVGKRIAGMPATNAGILNAADKAKCLPGALLIDPAMPSKSVLLERVLGTQDCGDMMPSAGLLDAEKACVQEWIGKFSVAAGNELTPDDATPSSGAGG